VWAGSMVSLTIESITAITPIFLAFLVEAPVVRSAINCCKVLKTLHTHQRFLSSKGLSHTLPPPLSLASSPAVAATPTQEAATTRRLKNDKSQLLYGGWL